MQDRPTERVRVLLDGLTASAIVDRVHPYYSGYQFEGEWLDTLKESIEGELDDLDRIIRGRAGTVGAVDNLREYALTAASVNATTRAVLAGYIDNIEREVEELRDRDYRNGREDAKGAVEFADRLKAAVDEREDVTLFGVDYTPLELVKEHLANRCMTLPLDADGVPIHVGDVLDGYGKAIEVVELRIGRSGWVLISRDGNGYADCAAFTHHYAPTVEDLLREYALKCEEAGK